MALGRFIQADTIVPSPTNPQSLNRYAYTLNNPLRYTDPTGHIVHLPFAAAAGAVIGGIIGAVTYFSSVPEGSRSPGGAALTIGTMAVAGALIGTGFGAAAGMTMANGAVIAATTASAYAQIGVGVMTAGLGNIAATGADFSPVGYTIDCVGGGISGAWNAALPDVGFAAALSRSGVSGGLAFAQSVAKDYLVDGNQPDIDRAARVGMLTFGADLIYDLGTQRASGVPWHRLDPRNGIVPSPSPSYRTGANFEFSSDLYHAVAEQLVRGGGQIVREYVYQTARDNLIR